MCFLKAELTLESPIASSRSKAITAAQRDKTHDNISHLQRRGTICTKSRTAALKTGLLLTCELYEDTMVDQLTFSRDNQERIHAVENSFGPSGKPLSHPGRVLMGEGRLMKQSRRGPQPKVFFLFNDVLVYGSIILNGRWHKKQQVIPLGEKLI